MSEMTRKRMYAYAMGLINMVNGEKQSKEAAFSVSDKEVKRRLRTVEGEQKVDTFGKKA